MAHRIDLPDLDAFPQPYWNHAQSVSAAFQSILNVNDEESGFAAYHQLLYALGNNHAGTYYPVALAVLPAMEGILRNGEPLVQRFVLEALIDLYGSFEPEPGHEQFRGVSLTHLIQQRISAMGPVLDSIATKGGVAARSAKELLELLQESSG